MRIALAGLLAVTLAQGAAHAGPLTPDLDPTGILLAQAPPPGYYQQPYAAPQPQPYYQQPYVAPPPPRMAYEERPRLGLLITGIVLLGLGYTMDIAITNAAGHSPLGEAFIPIAGPLLQMGDTYSDDGTRAAAVFFETCDFVLQAVGGTLTVLGLTLKKRVVVYADGTEAPVEDVKVAVVPGGAGARFMLSF